MNKLINRILELESNKDLGYVYVLKVEFTSRSGQNKVLYSVGCSLEDPVIKLQEILLSFYRERGYLPKATVSRQRKTSDYERISQLINYDLMDHAFSFGELSFVGSSKFVDIKQSELFAMYDELIPDTEGLRLINLMPRWSYLDTEIERMKEVSLEMDEDYAVIQAI